MMGHSDLNTILSIFSEKILMNLVFSHNSHNELFAKSIVNTTL